MLLRMLHKCMAENDLMVEAEKEEGDGNMEVLETEGENFQHPCLLTLWKTDCTLRPLVKQEHTVSAQLLELHLKYRIQLYPLIPECTVLPCVFVACLEHRHSGKLQLILACSKRCGNMVTVLHSHSNIINQLSMLVSLTAAPAFNRRSTIVLFPVKHTTIRTVLCY